MRAKIPAARTVFAVLAIAALAAGCYLQPHAQARKPAPVSPGPLLPSAMPGGLEGAIQPPPGCQSGRLVSGAADLHQALAGATPGAIIVLAAGVYAGSYLISVSGTPGQPITLCGGRDAVLDAGSIAKGYGLHLKDASWWNLVGFSVHGGQKGVVVDHGSHVLISGLYVHDVGEEGIHLRAMSTDNTIEGVTVSNTGLHSTKFGEGIYIGTAKSNWCTYTACNPDTSDRNVIRNNDISHTTAENIDIKEGTTGGQVIGNRLSGDGMVEAAATAWVNAKGNSWTISDNAGRNSPKDGFQVHEILAGWGVANVFRGNRAEVDGPGYGFYIQRASLATMLGCDNTAIGAARGLSNGRCTP
jgi:hypothetical protein